MEQRVNKWVVTARIAIVLIILLLLATLAYYWPLAMLLAFYLLVSAALIARNSYNVFSGSEHANVWQTMLANFANARLQADPPFTRLRRRLAAVLLILADALLWLRTALVSLAGRPFMRRNAAGQWVPRRHRLTTLFYGFYFANAAMFALLPLSLLWLSINGYTAESLALTLFCLLVVSLFARHLAMLIFPHDLKTSMRRTPGDPRVFFVVYLFIDTFAFAVLAYFVGMQAGTSLPGLNGFKNVLADVLSISELRALSQALMQTFDAELPQIAAGLLQTLSQVTLLQAFEMLCSSFVYLNIIRMLFPLDSWKQNDEDLEVIASSLLIGGCAEEARSTLAKIKDYDVEAAQLDALLTAHRGDLKAAAKKMRWAHARNALSDDADLIFMDVVGQSMLIPESSVNAAQAVGFGLDNNVSDVVLVAIISMGFSNERIDPREALGIIKSKERLADYPLSTAFLEIGSGDLASARARLATCVPTDVVAHCTWLLIKEVAASSPTVAGPSINQAAEHAVVSVNAVALEELTLAQQLTLVSILICFRCAIASRGETAPVLTALSSKILANIREFYPSHRNVALLENYGRIVEAQARRQAKSSAPLMQSA